MTPSVGENAGCRIVGDFVEKNELDEVGKSAAIGFAEPTRIVATFIDSWPGDVSYKQFKVLLRDNRIATVRGHALRYLKNSSNPSDLGSYGIVSAAGQAEVLIALFPVSEVTGIFSGDLELTRASA